LTELKKVSAPYSYHLTLNLLNASNPKTSLRAYLERIRRKYPGVAWIWRLDFTNAGTPHFHAFLFSDRKMDVKELEGAWKNILKCRSPFLAKGKKSKHLFYLAKEEPGEGASGYGRRWGKSKNLPDFQPYDKAEVTEDELTEIIARHCPHAYNYIRSALVFGKRASAWIQDARQVLAYLLSGHPLPGGGTIGGG
jgi:hypothetical protein